MDRRRLIRKLEAASGGPVLVIAASWRADIATDLDIAAARGVADLVDDLDTDHLTVVYAARGGDAAFADSVARSLRARNIRFDLALPTLVTAAGSLLALASERVRIHPHGGVGAYDAGPLRNRQPEMSHALYDDIPALGGIRYEHDPALPTRLAAGMRERRLSRELAQRLVVNDADFDALSHLRLGYDLGLDAAQLTAAGFNAETWDEPALWALFGALETELGLLSLPEPPYTQSEIGAEVEFAPAVGLLGAVLETRKRSLRFELDTGSPDPDTGVYTGAWIR